MQKYYDSDRYQIDDKFYYHTMVNNDKSRYQNSTLFNPTKWKMKLKVTKK